jgi:hypothetical protein
MSDNTLIQDMIFNMDKAIVKKSLYNRNKEGN